MLAGKAFAVKIKQLALSTWHLASRENAGGKFCLAKVLIAKC
jgi:hypothetical protein